MKKFFIPLFLITFFSTAVFAQNQKASTDSGQKQIYSEAQKKLQITQEDIVIVPEKTLETKGYHIYIRKKPGIESVILTETTKDPAGKQDNYAYRALEYNPINGDEERILDGKKLVSEGAKYSLVDSTPEDFEKFGKAFHIYVPQKIQYGYAWSRNGVIELGKGTFINIRAFQKKYADYSGNFLDNPFMFDFIPKKKKSVKKSPPEVDPIKEVPVQEVEEEPEEIILTDDYNPVASEKFQEIAEWMIYSKGPDTIIDDIMESIDRIKSKDADIVFAIDATGSMKNDIDMLKRDLVPSLLKKFKEFNSVRLGLLFYRDYPDNFRYKDLPVRFYEFTVNENLFWKNLNAIEIKGKEGGDIPEAVYEALYASCEFYEWRADVEKKVILIGDAEPHPTPRGTGKYSKEFAAKAAKAKDIKIDAILLPSE